MLLGIFMAISPIKRETIVKEYGGHGIAKASKDKVLFLDSVIKGYHNKIDDEVDKSFYKDFPLYGNLSARYYISNYDESIIYIYPSDGKLIRIDYLDKPAQILLTHGLIDLNNPESDIYPEKLLLLVSKDEAITAYKNWPSNLKAGGENSRFSGGFAGEGTVKFNNFMKLVQFVSSETMMIFSSGTLAFSTSDPITKSIYGRDMEFIYNLKGPLIISNITNFKNASDIGEKIGVSLAETQLKQLIVKSKAFKYYVDEKKLKPLAEAIVAESKKSESDPTLYPFWKFKDDLYKMHDYAKKEGISEGYVDDLIGMLKAGSMTGTLLFYYKNGHEFVIQWLLINAILFTIMTLLVLVNVADVSLLEYLLPYLRSVNIDKFLLSAIIVVVNGWVFTVKPTHLDIRSWIIPGISIISNLCVSGYLQKYFIK